ncbi:hypothetical protein GCM10025870_28260 [Agromyces marinus]|uniref:Uncharacterized protein n=1 Tax=Agromyces marinus TaxID=1389020 RepID=A0ABM8H4L9_9MICO|nr:hypothetical protein GCM10025870_28260 [Agromyces marinus]
MSDGQLDRIRRGIHQGLHHLRHVLDPGDEARFTEEPMIHGHVEQPPGCCIEQPIQTNVIHDVRPPHLCFRLSEKPLAKG